MKKRLITVGIASFALTGGLLTAAPAMAAEAATAQGASVTATAYDHHGNGDHRDRHKNFKQHHKNFRHHHRNFHGFDRY